MERLFIRKSEDPNAGNPTPGCYCGVISEIYFAFYINIISVDQYLCYNLTYLYLNLYTAFQALKSKLKSKMKSKNPLEVETCLSLSAVETK